MSVTYSRQYRPIRTDALADAEGMHSGIVCEMERSLNNAYKHRHRPLLWRYGWPGLTSLSPGTTTETKSGSIKPWTLAKVEERRFRPNNGLCA